MFMMTELIHITGMMSCEKPKTEFKVFFILASCILCVYVIFSLVFVVVVVVVYNSLLRLGWNKLI